MTGNSNSSLAISSGKPERLWGDREIAHWAGDWRGAERRSQSCVANRGRRAGNPGGRAVGNHHWNIYGSMAGKALGLELEGLNAEDREFEAARQFVRFAGETVKNAIDAPPSLNPVAAAKAAAAELPGTYAEVHCSCQLECNWTSSSPPSSSRPLGSARRQKSVPVRNLENKSERTKPPCMNTIFPSSHTKRKASNTRIRTPQREPGVGTRRGTDGSEQRTGAGTVSRRPDQESRQRDRRHH